MCQILFFFSALRSSLLPKECLGDEPTLHIRGECCIQLVHKIINKGRGLKGANRPRQALYISVVLTSFSPLQQCRTRQQSTNLHMRLEKIELMKIERISRVGHNTPVHYTFLLQLGSQLSNYHIVPILNTREVENGIAMDLYR